MLHLRVDILLVVLFLFAGILLCFPLIFNWKLMNDDIRTYYFPEYFEDSLKYAIAAAVPLIVDSMLDMSLTSLFRPLRVILLLAVTIPNIVFINITFSPATYFVLFQLRYMICACICYVHLFVYGDEFFRRWHFIVMTILNNFSAVIFTWASFTTTYFRILVIFFYVGFAIGCVMFSYYVMLWCAKLTKLQSNEISNDDRRCGAYLFSMGIVGISFIVMIILYGPYIITAELYPYLTTCTYVSLAFIVSVWLLHGRIIRLEIEKSKVRLALPPL